MERRSRGCWSSRDILEGDLTFNILASKYRLFYPVHENPDICQWGRHDVGVEVDTPSARRRPALPVMNAAKIGLDQEFPPA